MKLDRVLESCLCVDDLDAAEGFYRDVLGLQLYARQDGRHLFFRCGRQMVLLFIAAASEVSDGGVPPHGTRGAGHLAFAVADRDWEDWRRRLERHGVAIEQIVEWPHGGRSIYFRDPAGNSLELATPELWGLASDAESE